MEEKERKEGTGLKSRCYFGKLLFKDKQAQTSHLSSRNRSHFGNCRCLWEDFKAEGELQGAVSKVPTFCGCATSPWGLFQWHQTHRTWGTQQDTCTALGEPRVTCPGLPRSTPLTTLYLRHQVFPSLLWLGELCDAQRPGGALGSSEDAEGKPSVQ